jgi:hypothetical protein
LKWRVDAPACTIPLEAFAHPLESRHALVPGHDG